MNEKLRKAFILMMSGLFLLSAACTTIKPVYDLDDEPFASQVKAGDRVRLTYLDGRIQEINITGVSETEIKGTIHKNTQTQRRSWRSRRHTVSCARRTVYGRGWRLRMEPGF